MRLDRLRHAARGALFWLRVTALAARELMFGIVCVGCATRVRLPVPRGWKFETTFDGSARWSCGHCRWAQADRPHPWS